MVEVGKVYRLKYDFMNEPQWFLVTENTEIRNGKEFHVLLRTDWMLWGVKPRLSDYWLCSDDYLSMLMENGDLVLEEKQEVG